MYLARLSHEQYLPVVFSSYYSYSLNNQSSGFTLKMNQSSSSINNVYMVMRDSNYTEHGIRSRKTEGSNTDAFVPNYFCFKSFNNHTTKIDSSSLSWHAMCNSVKFPQFDASPLTGAANCAYISDRVSQHQKGNMITSLKQYLSSAFVLPIPLGQKTRRASKKTPI